MTATIIIPPAIWKANRERREKLKAEQQMVEAVLKELDDEPALTFDEALRRCETRGSGQ